MGYRTLVMLYNDQASSWENDPMLGAKIAQKSWEFGERSLGYGAVIGCVHADRQELAVIDSYSVRTIANDNWRGDESVDHIELKLLAIAAEKLGYKLTKA